MFQEQTPGQAAQASSPFDGSGGFAAPEREAAFLATQTSEIRDFSRFAGYVAMLFHFIMLLLDFWQFGREPVFFELAAFRVVCIGIALGFIHLLAQLNDISRLFLLITFGEAVLVGQLAANWFWVPQPAMLPIAVTITSVLGFYLLVPNMVWGALANAIGISLAFLAYAFGKLDLPPADVVILSAGLAAVNALGFLAMRKARVGRRLAYLEHLDLERINAELVAVREEARSRESYLAWALDALPIGLSIVNPQGKVHIINQKARQLLNLSDQVARQGISLEDILQFFAGRGDYGRKNMEDFLHFLHGLTSGEMHQVMARQVSAGRILNFSAGRLPDKSIAFAVTDISQQYEAQRRLRNAVEAAGDGMAIFDADDRLVVCSRRYAELYGLTVEQAVGKGFEELEALGRGRGLAKLPNTDQPLSDAGQSGATLPGSDRANASLRSSDIRTPAGEWYLVQERITAEGDLVVVRSDITGRRRIEDELRTAKTEAEQALAELRETQATLVTSEKMASLGAMVAGLSHEISTPLGIGVSAASHLTEEFKRIRGRLKEAGVTRPELEDFISACLEATRILESNLERASRLMRALKQVSTDQSSDAIRAFDVLNYLDEILLSLAPATKRVMHRVEMACPAGLVIEQRPGAFAQIVTNLVMNALQHGFEGRIAPGLVRVAVSVPDDRHIRLEVSDDGIGMPDDVREHVFEPFYTTRRNAGGSGLGLHIVYTLVTQALGGRIHVESQSGHGTRFVVLFPRQAAVEAAS